MVLVATAATLALAAALIACASFAHAQQASRPIAAGEVPGRLAERGYAVSGSVLRRGQAYLAHGTDRRGQRVRLVLDARTAEIIGFRVVSPQGRAGQARQR